MGRGTPWLGVVLGTALGGSLAACSASPYQCASDDQCVRAGLVGMCTEVSFCAYPDNTCNAGLRYSPNAGDGLADTCVLLSDGESGEESDDAPTAETSDPTADCGNGEIDADEECDDGNLEGGDWCTPQCTRAGGELWVQHYAGPEGGDDRATALGIRSDGGVLVGGEQAEADDTWSAILLGYDPEGAPLTSGPWIHPEPADRRLHGLALIDLDVMVVGEELSEGFAGGRAWYARLESGLEAQQVGAIDTVAPESARAVGLSDWGFVLVGSQDDRGWARWLDAERPDWQGEELEQLHAAAVRPDGAFMLAGDTGTSSRQWWLLSPAGEVLIQGIAEADIVAVGFDGWGRPVIGGAQGGRPWLEVHGLDGTVAWTLSAGFDDQTGVTQAIAAAPDGHLYAAGVDEVGTRGWIARFDDQGMLRWAHAVREGSEVVLPRAVAHRRDDAGEVLYVAGAETGAGGDMDLFVASLRP